VKDLQESVNVSLMRYKGGTATYLSVLDSQRSLFGAELTLAQARNNEYQSLVQLYKALGGAGNKREKSAQKEFDEHSDLRTRRRATLASI